MQATLPSLPAAEGRCVQEPACAGSDIESIDMFGNTPIWRGVMANSMDVVSLLVERGANLDHENLRAITPRSILGQVKG
ncbi:hypothetical protein [Pseudomonas chlororaphis]